MAATIAAELPTENAKELTAVGNEAPPCGPGSPATKWRVEKMVWNTLKNMITKTFVYNTFVPKFVKVPSNVAKENKQSTKA